MPFPATTPTAVFFAGAGAGAAGEVCGFEGGVAGAVGVVGGFEGVGGGAPGPGLGMGGWLGDWTTMTNFSPLPQLPVWAPLMKKCGPETSSFTLVFPSLYSFNGFSVLQLS